MRTFRCYFIAESGKATASLVIQSSTPAQAAKEAMQRFAGRPYIFVEVWDGSACELTATNAHIPIEVERRLRMGVSAAPQGPKNPLSEREQD